MPLDLRTREPCRHGGKFPHYLTPGEGKRNEPRERGVCEGVGFSNSERAGWCDGDWSVSLTKTLIARKIGGSEERILPGGGRGRDVFSSHAARGVERTGACKQQSKI